MPEAEKLGDSKKAGPRSLKGKFTLLVFMACLLSFGSLIWTTYSLLDLFQGGGIDPANLSKDDLSLIGLSAAATADISWTGTLIAEYRGNRWMVSMPLKKNADEVRKQFNVLPLIGWIEVLFVAGLLAYHGLSMSGGAAGFAAALPIMTKLSWVMALTDLKDPADLTHEEQDQIAATHRRSRMLLAQALATEEEHEAELEAQRRQNAALLEAERAQAEMKRLAQETAFELEKARMRAENDLKAMRNEMSAELAISNLQARQRVELMRLDADYEMSLRVPFGQNVLTGQVINTSLRPELLSSTDPDNDTPSLENYGLSQKSADKARLARNYYTVSAQHGGSVTKKAFSIANGVHPPRLTEATTDFPVEWFMERGLATWTTP